MKKLINICLIIIAVISLTACTGKTNKDMIVLAKGETLELVEGKSYIFGKDIKSGTYNVDFEKTEEYQGTFTIIISETCTYGDGKKEIDEKTMNHVHEPIIFEDGFILEVFGAPKIMTLQYESDVKIGFPKGQICNK